MLKQGWCDQSIFAFSIKTSSELILMPCLHPFESHYIFLCIFKAIEEQVKMILWCH